jgi:hypothetical protein
LPIVHKIKAVYFAQELGVFLEVCGEWFAELEEGVNQIQNKPITCHRLHSMKLQFFQIQTNCLAEPEEDAFFASGIFHQLLNNIRNLRMKIEKFGPKRVHVFLMLFRSELVKMDVKVRILPAQSFMCQAGKAKVSAEVAASSNV